MKLAKELGSDIISMHMYAGDELSSALVVSAEGELGKFTSQYASKVEQKDGSASVVGDFADVVDPDF